MDSNFNFDLTRKRVRLNGRALTKFELSRSIDNLAHYLMFKYHCPVHFPLVTTIYPTEFEYSFYVNELRKYMRKLALYRTLPIEDLF